MSDSDWMERTKCSDKDLPKFFGTLTQQREAINKLCHRCPVMEECLMYYLKIPRRNRYGAAAGLTESQLQHATWTKIDRLNKRKGA